jgi:polysaccharide pyruvyl transferase WcaK-like protein
LAKQRRAPVDVLVFFPAQDQTFAERLKALCPEVNRVRVPGRAADVLDWMKEYRFVASSRFHALVLAQAARIPFLGLGSQPKVISFCARYGQPHATHPLDAQALVAGNKSDILGPHSD